MKSLVTQAPVVWKVLKELNELECRPPRDYIEIQGDPEGQHKVVVRPSYADHPLVVGPRYQEQDLPVSWSNYLGFNTSGVLIFGIKSGTLKAKYLRENRSTRAYRISGVFGQATDDCFKTGKVVERSTWRHVKRSHMDHLLSSMQSSHQKKMFEICGVDMQSQTAYELASQGLIRPANSKLPVIYGMKCVEFGGPQLPHFAIEIQCINEYESYLTGLVHEIGLKMHSTAHCTGIQCIRHSRFTLEDALLMKHWTLQAVIDNIQRNNKILKEFGGVLKQQSASLVG
ncbi:pseudouridylate synthase TRUB2, mitochondrial isoform X2 [Cylas formicarius]|uniref:pseudouridylate synthase TRUB2, mitochondrial isoform X2 n=1 Tax=Cylas formicarius TaxID=197179 RepID=UPI0029588486|nr:pseudouridylate synthase TRUB2, mitochondrial isoform X2 [Cylas formicarius]